MRKRTVGIHGKDNRIGKGSSPVKLLAICQADQDYLTGTTVRVARLALTRLDR